MSFIFPISSTLISDPPTLPEMIQYKGRTRTVNIPQEIGTAYKDFGTLLLDDNIGNFIASLEFQYQRDPQHINHAILRQWLSGTGRKPVSWTTLRRVMEATNLRELAHELHWFQLYYISLVGGVYALTFIILLSITCYSCNSLIVTPLLFYEVLWLWFTHPYNYTIDTLKNACEWTWVVTWN